MWINQGIENYSTTCLLVSEENFNKIEKLPGYSSETLYGREVIYNERGKIEGLVVSVSKKYSDKIYVADVPLIYR